MLKIKYKIGNLIKESNTLETSDYKIEKVIDENNTKLTIYPKKELTLLEAFIDIEHKYSKKECIYLNGYQSWTDTREFEIYEKINTLERLPLKVVNMYHFKEYGDEYFKKYEKHVLHGYTFSYIRNKENNESILFGSLNDFNSYLIINHRVKENIIRLESDIKGRIINKEFTLFNYVTLKGNYLSISKEYLNNFKVNESKSIKGYTSWYNHYQNINEELILKNLDAIDNKNYDLFQIDDGSETYVGDWLDIDLKKFPNGLKPIVDKIHDKGLKAGIWLAPLVCETNSKIFKEHKDYLYLENNNPVPCGCNWSTDYVLDIRKEEVINYIKECLRYYVDLGFDFFKLDFLYASALIKDSNYTKAELMDYILNILKEELKGKSILVCGVQLSSAFNKADYARIGPDISLIFDDVWYMKFMHRERISTKVTLVNTIYRSIMNNTCFLNDPDVYLLRDDNIKLNKKQKEAIITLNHLCGNVFMTSDDVSKYSEENKVLLKNSQKLIGSEIVDIRKNKGIIDVDYLNNNKKYTLRYLIKKGEIKWIKLL